MKKILISLFFAVTFSSCMAQNPIIPLTTMEYGDIENAYYKDTQGYFDDFVGTWIYTNGNEIFKIIIKKQSQELVTSFKNYFTDYLYAEYRYVDENGVELVNSLSSINDPNMDPTDHLIWGNDILTAPTIPPPCEDCQQGERRVRLPFKDPQRTYLNQEVILRILPDPYGLYPNERMELVLTSGAGLNMVPQGVPIQERIPHKTYILIKQ